jgi:hypothetical protein
MYLIYDAKAFGSCGTLYVLHLLVWTFVEYAGGTNGGYYDAFSLFRCAQRHRYCSKSHLQACCFASCYRFEALIPGFDVDTMTVALPIGSKR